MRQLEARWCDHTFSKLCGLLTQTYCFRWWWLGDGGLVVDGRWWDKCGVGDDGRCVGGDGLVMVGWLVVVGGWCVIKWLVVVVS